MSDLKSLAKNGYITQLNNSAIGQIIPSTGVFTSLVTDSLTTINQTITGDLTVADKIVHLNDTNTNIRFPAADKLTVETNGVERLRVDSNGVGIGASNPQHRLSIFGTNSQSSTISINLASDASTTSYLNFKRARGDTEVSVATTQSGDVHGTILWQAANNVNTNTISARIDVVQSNSTVSSGEMRFATGGNSERMRITAGGNVGIGVTNPAGLLEVFDVLTVTPRNTTSILNKRGLSIYNNQSNGLVDTTLVYGNTTNSYVAFGNHNGATYSERMRISANGNVGVGTTTPVEKHHVEGNARAWSFIATTSSPAAPAFDFIDDPNTGMYLAAADTLGFATNGVPAAQFTSTGNLRLFNTTGTFYTEISTQPIANNTLTLPNSGNVTLVSGTMVPTTGSGATGTWAISVTGNANTVTNGVYTEGTQTINGAKSFTTAINSDRPTDFWTSNPGTYYKVSNLGGLSSEGAFAVSITSNGYRKNDATWQSYGANGLNGASQITLNPDGNIYFRTDTTLASGNTQIAPTIRATINGSGNMGIGTTTPSTKLQVSGEVTAVDYNTTSDLNVKKNIQRIDDAVFKVLQINGVTFNFIDDPDEQRHAGVIAQDVEKVLPEAVKELDSGIKHVAYGNLIGLLVEAIKEQQKQIDDLRTLINK